MVCVAAVFGVDVGVAAVFGVGVGVAVVFGGMECRPQAVQPIVHNG